MHTMEQTEAAIHVGFFRSSGFLTLRRFFDPEPLALEINRVLFDGLPPGSQRHNYSGIHFQYVPMMSAETPSSLALLSRIEQVAQTLLGSPVLPTRAKAVRYAGNTPWHRDSSRTVASLGFAAYLEPLSAENGALRVVPGSHVAGQQPAADLPGYVLDTEPGDMIVFDEHLFHASSGGGVRRQWRADYLRVPVDAAAERETRSYFKDLYAPDWDGRYDAERYPSYGAAWRASGIAAVARLEALGVFELAEKQEEFMRSQRRNDNNLREHS